MFQELVEILLEIKRCKWLGDKLLDFLIFLFLCLAILYKLMIILNCLYLHFYKLLMVYAIVNIIFHYFSVAYFEAGGVWKEDIPTKTTGEEGAFTIISIKYKCNAFFFYHNIYVDMSKKDKPATTPTGEEGIFYLS